MNRASGTKPSNPWNKSSNIKQNAQKKFNQVQQKQQAALSKFVNSIESSSDEEELAKDNVIDLATKNYSLNGASLGRTQIYLEDALTSGAATCLICISTVKRTQSIWSCSDCYTFFHLMCIQRWSKDTITHKRQALTDQIQVRRIDIVWGCPKCRRDYDPNDIPSGYYCFCRKQENPDYQAFLVPHSCGQLCEKALKPECGHGCKLLCHPGPCPPCSQTINSTCYCGAGRATLRRCSAREWSCGAVCSRPLSCTKHRCQVSCHIGACAPCEKKIIQSCNCEGSKKLRDCDQPVWQCDKVCDKPLRCGFHRCKEVCHKSTDPNHDECQLSKVRTCPCGKSYFEELPCTQETPLCGDTCGKLLSCGVHSCNKRCHKEECGTCTEAVTKTCRCGKFTNQVQCSKPYFCETKCKQQKDCVRHPCNRKCCDDNCPPCEKPCDRSLQCGKHKCASVCHRGPCYPCHLTDKKFCRCGGTYIQVPCGRKSRGKPPKCTKLCTLPSICDHPKQTAHTCHPGDCPPCRQVCGKSRPDCKHDCPSHCHTAVATIVKQSQNAASMPWEVTAPRLEKKCLPCPACVVPVEVTCIGLHETINWPCHNSKPSSCHRACGRQLPCGNHFCELPCHTVTDALDSTKAGCDCQQCQKPCLKQRPVGCTHPCPRPCHPDTCNSCPHMVRVRCHCGLNQPYVRCNDLTTLAEEDKIKALSCGNQCPNNYDCGHRCRANCHPGSCVNVEVCRKKVKITCACKRLRKEFQCQTVRSGDAIVHCDEICVQKVEEQRVQREVEEAKRKEEEDLKNREELQKYEKLMNGKKKYKAKRHNEEVVERSFLKKYWMIIIASVLGMFTALYTLTLT